jgi:acyl-CoA thioesterase-1
MEDGNRSLLPSVRLLLLVALLLRGAAPFGCSSSSGSGTSASGGATAGSGGNKGTGGASGSGGARGSGGVSASSGGASNAGGSGAGGGGTGGSGSGGQLGTGGSASGGQPGTGGSASGGQPAPGGATGAGGKTTGGGAGAGGRPGSGGGGGGTNAGGAAGGSSGSGGTSSSTLRLMPLGDSTTASICYRSHLWQLLLPVDRVRFDFVGTRNGDPGCSFTGYDKDNEGHGGYIVTDVLKATSTGRPSGADASDPYDSSAKDLATWFDGHPADVVIMHFGTNDVWNGKDPADILKAYSAILARLRANNPNVRLMIAQITPMNPSGCGDKCTNGVPALNAMIPGWATQNSTTSSPITVVDQYTNFDPATDTKDGVHANDMGSVKIATNWFNALGRLP